MVIGIFTTVSIVFRWLLIAIPPMLVIFFLMGMFFRRTIRQVKRLEGLYYSIFLFIQYYSIFLFIYTFIFIYLIIKAVYRSPIISHVQQSMGGLLSIKSFSQEDRFIHVNIFFELFYLFF